MKIRQNKMVLILQTVIIGSLMNPVRSIADTHHLLLHLQEQSLLNEMADKLKALK
jgi:hypothetical protein